jgi:hypothetical protein
MGLSFDDPFNLKDYCFKKLKIKWFPLTFYILKSCKNFGFIFSKSKFVKEIGLILNYKAFILRVNEKFY